MRAHHTVRIFAKLPTFLDFASKAATSHLVRAHFPAEPASPRLRLVMEAPDGDLAGASYRDIAVVLLAKRASMANEAKALIGSIASAARSGAGTF